MSLWLYKSRCLPIIIRPTAPTYNTTLFHNILLRWITKPNHIIHPVRSFTTPILLRSFPAHPLLYIFKLQHFLHFKSSRVPVFLSKRSIFHVFVFAFTCRTTFLGLYVWGSWPISSGSTFLGIEFGKLLDKLRVFIDHSSRLFGSTEGTIIQLFPFFHHVEDAFGWLLGTNKGEELLLLLLLEKFLLGWLRVCTAGARLGRGFYLMLL